MCRNPAPRREPGARTARTVTGGSGIRGYGSPSGGGGGGCEIVTTLTANGVGTCGADDNQAQAGHLIASTGYVALCLNAGGMGQQDYETETLIAARETGKGFWTDDGLASLRAEPGGMPENVVAHTLTRRCAAVEEDGTGRGEPIVPIAFDTTQLTSAGNYSNPQPGDPCHPIAAGAHPPAVAFAVDMRGRDGKTQIEMREDGVANTLRTPSGGRSGEGIRDALIDTAVRRLTPVECARLQGFPDIRKTAIIRLWSCEHPEGDAPAETSSLRWRKPALLVSESESMPSVCLAGRLSAMPLADRAKPADVSVRIDYVLREVHLLSRGRLLWSASTADEQSSFPLSMPIGAFVRLVADTLGTVAPTTPIGRAVLLENGRPSIPPLNGENASDGSGPGIVQPVGVAPSNGNPAGRSTMFTTLAAMPSSPNSVPISETLCCSVADAIASFIPVPTCPESSCDLELTEVREYLDAPFKGKPAADGPRYRALGNSMAVPAMRWIGERIAAVETLAMEPDGVTP